MKLNRVGEGNTAELYTVSNERIRKIFKTHVPIEMIMKEYLIGKSIEAIDVKTPKIYTLFCSDSERYIEMEYIQGTDFLHDFTVTSSESFIAQLAELQLAVHRQTVKSVPSLYEVIQDKLVMLPADMKQQGEDLFSRVISHPSSSSHLLHGDFHPQNILKTSTNDLVVIDWNDATSGPPIADVARTLLLMRTAGDDLLTDETRVRICRLYYTIYTSKSIIRLSELENWIRLCALLRTQEQLSLKETDCLLKLVNKEDLLLFFFESKEK